MAIPTILSYCFGFLPLSHGSDMKSPRNRYDFYVHDQKQTHVIYSYTTQQKAITFNLLIVLTFPTSIFLCTQEKIDFRKEDYKNKNGIYLIKGFYSSFKANNP